MRTGVQNLKDIISTTQHHFVLIILSPQNSLSCISWYFINNLCIFLYCQHSLRFRKEEVRKYFNYREFRTFSLSDKLFSEIENVQNFYIVITKAYKSLEAFISFFSGLKSSSVNVINVNILISSIVCIIYFGRTLIVSSLW